MHETMSHVSQIVFQRSLREKGNLPVISLVSGSATTLDSLGEGTVVLSNNTRQTSALIARATQLNDKSS